MAISYMLAHTGEHVLAGMAQLLVGMPRLIYEVDFSDESLSPIYDPLGLGPMYRTATANLGLSGSDLDRTMELVGGARFTVEKPRELAADVSVSLGAAVALPPEVRSFRIMATYAWPHGPRTEVDAWASVIFAREAAWQMPGQPSSIEPLDNNTRIVVTLQSAWNGDRSGARMNTPLPVAGTGAGPWLPVEVVSKLFAPVPPLPRTRVPNPHGGEVPPAPPYPVFSLAMHVDRTGPSPRGSATLDLPPTYGLGFAQTRSFDHPFMALKAPDGYSNNIGAAGVQIAVARGYGPASVIVRDFRVFALTGRDWVGGLVSAVSSTGVGSGMIARLRSVHNRMVNFAFKGLTEAGSDEPRSEPGPLMRRLKRARRSEHPPDLSSPANASY